MTAAQGIQRDMRVFDVAVHGNDLVISLYGGPSNACGSVRFTFDKPTELADRLELVESWRQDRRPVALVTEPNRIVLVDERRLTEAEEAA